MTSCPRRSSRCCAPQTRRSWCLKPRRAHRAARCRGSGRAFAAPRRAAGALGGATRSSACIFRNTPSGRRAARAKPRRSRAYCRPCRAGRGRWSSSRAPPTAARISRTGGTPPWPGRTILSRCSSPGLKTRIMQCRSSRASNGRRRSARRVSGIPSRGSSCAGGAGALRTTAAAAGICSGRSTPRIRTRRFSTAARAFSITRGGRAARAPRAVRPRQ